MTRIALLDVNVLVALFDPDHLHHDLAHDTHLPADTPSFSNIDELVGISFPTIGDSGSASGLRGPRRDGRGHFRVQVDHDELTAALFAQAVAVRVEVVGLVVNRLVAICRSEHDHQP